MFSNEIEALPQLGTTGVITQRVVDLAVGFLALLRTPGTVDSYGANLRRFLLWCHERHIEPLEATRSHVGLYRKWLEARGLAPATVHLHLSALTSFYRFCVEEEAIAKSPMEQFKLPWQDYTVSTTQGLNRAELAQFLKAADEAKPLVRATAYLFALNGLRSQECCGAAVENLREHDGRLSLMVLRKGGRPQEIPLAAKAAEAVRAAVGERTSGPVLLSRRGVQLDRSSIYYLMRHLGVQAGLAKKVTPMVLRHSFITNSLDAGVSMRDVQDAAGHRDPKTTRRYDRDRFSVERHATFALDRFLQSAPAPDPVPSNT